MLQQLGQALEAEDATAVTDTLAEVVTLRVAVHDEPFEGVQAASRIVAVVLDGVLHDIRVTETIGVGGAAAVLMFSARVAGQADRADGLLVARPGGSARICDLTVFLRPLSALQALADEMGRRLGGPGPDGGA